MKHKQLAALMGRKVLVKTDLIRLSVEHKIDEEEQTDRGEDLTWIPVALESPRVGWVTGFRHLQNGTSARPTVDNYHTGEPVLCDYREWTETAQRTQCLLVTFWPTEKAVRVPLDGYEIGEHVDLLDPHATQAEWTDSDRANQREMMANCPRSKNGRWA